MLRENARMRELLPSFGCDGDCDDPRCRDCNHEYLLDQAMHRMALAGGWEYYPES